MTATADIVATLIVCSQKIPDGGYGQAAQEVESSFHRMFEASRMSSPNFEELYLAKLGTMMELNAQTWGSSTSSEPRAAKVTRCNDKLTNAKYWMGVFNAKVKAAGRK